MKTILFIFLFTFSAVTMVQSEEYLLDLPLTRSVMNLEKGVLKKNSSYNEPLGGVLFPTKIRIHNEHGTYFHEMEYEDKQIIKKELLLLHDRPEQISFYWPGDPAPRLIVLSKLSMSVVITTVASFDKERNGGDGMNNFTELICEYGSYRNKN